MDEEMNRVEGDRSGVLHSAPGACGVMPLTFKLVAGYWLLPACSNK